MATATKPSSSAITSASTMILNHSAPMHYNFRFSPFLRSVHQIDLPSDRPVCRAFQAGHCPNGTRCPERHVAPDSKTASSSNQQHSGGLNSLVCKHWLRGLCKKGEHCEFLHEYNLRKMPECNFFMRNGYCSNGEECLYLHIDPLSRLPPCPHYDMGFCPLGPKCSKKHVRRKLCVFYLAGFCPDGPDCKVGAHAKWTKDLDKPTTKSEEREKQEEEREGRIAMLAAERGGEEDGDGRGGDRDGGRGGFRYGRGGRWRGGGPGGGGGGGGRGRFRGRGH